MSLSRFVRSLAALRTAFALVLVPVVLAACNSGGFFGTLPAHVRVFNALVDAPPINVTVFTTPIVSNLPFQGLTGYQNVDAGNREVKVSLAGGVANIYDQTTLIVDDAQYTYVVFGTTAAPLVQILTDAVVQDVPPLAGTFKFRVSNSAADTAFFDVYLTQPGASLDNTSPNFTAVPYSTTTSYSTFNTATLQIRFTQPNSKQVIYDSGPVTFTDRGVYELIGYTLGSTTLVNGALLVVDTAGSGSIVNSLLAQFKVVHAAPNTAPINAFIDGSIVFANIPYQSASLYNGLASGTHTFTAETVTSPGAVIASAQPLFAPATDTSIVVTGVPGAQTAVVLTDMNLVGTAGTARVRFVNVASDAGPVDVLVNFAKTIPALDHNAASRYVEEVEDFYTVSFATAGTTNSLLTVTQLALTAGRTYSMYLVGTVGQYSYILTRDD